MEIKIFRKSSIYYIFLEFWSSAAEAATRKFEVKIHVAGGMLDFAEALVNRSHTLWEHSARI